MSQAQFTILEDRGILAVSGPDRREFLQGLVSNDVARLAQGRALYAALLTAQGKYLHDFIMIEVGEAIWLDAEAARLADLKRRLSMYRLRAKVEIVERQELAVAAVFGDEALASLDLSDEPGTARRSEGGVALVDPRLAALGARLVMERDGIAVVAATFAASNAASYDRHRLTLGIPDGSRDLMPEKSILLEAGFDELHGIDWQKGCYVGQELTARTKYRGLIKKRLFPVSIDGPAPQPGALVMREGREAGEMHSSRDGLGLALLRLEAVVEGATLEAGGATIVPHRPDWMRLNEAYPSTDELKFPVIPAKVGIQEGSPN